MAVPQFISAYAQAIYDAIISKFKAADLPGVNIDAWGPLGLTVNLDGSIGAFDAVVHRTNLKTHLDALGYALPAMPLAAPASPQATASSDTAQNITASSVLNATGYKLFASAAGTNMFVQLGGTLLSPNYARTGLTANTFYDYQWQALGNGTTYADSPRSATFSGKTNVAATYIALILSAFDQAKIPNLSLTGDVFAGTVADVWSGVTTKVLPLATAGWMEFTVLDITKENGLLIADSDAAIPNGEGFYGNDFGLKNSFGALGVINAGASTNYGVLANGDKARMNFAADNTWQIALSHDNGQTFAASLVTGTRTTALILKIAGQAGKQLKGVSYNGFA